jgi:hypothetical protein
LASFCQGIDSLDFSAEINKIDVSNLWIADSVRSENDSSLVDRPEPLGFIGEEFQRMRIHFISVIKNSEKPGEYLVYGKTKVKNNICEFQGFIRIKNAKTYYNEKQSAKIQGVINGEYVFMENPNQAGSGKFAGKFETLFCLDKSGQLIYNNYALGADEYKNNQFSGEWKSYKTGIKKICNWGDYRIPDCGDLDQGAAYFSPLEKYYDKGWEFYEKIYSQKEFDQKFYDEALKIENSNWWE